MKYFFDTEFIEGFRKPLFGKRSHFIDLISIGIICEDGRTYYAVCNEFDVKDADEWVKVNVIDKINIELWQTDVTGSTVNLKRIKNGTRKFITRKFWSNTI